MTPTPAQFDGGDWALDPTRSALDVRACRLGSTWVECRFRGVTGRLRLDRLEPPLGSCEGEIDVTTFEPAAPRLNSELRIADVLDLERYPAIPFRARIAGHPESEGLVAQVTVSINGRLCAMTLSLEVSASRWWRRAAAAPAGAQPVALELRASGGITREQLRGPVSSDTIPWADRRGRVEITLLAHAVPCSAP
jgi:polyisoprenoid-binding protein YceI